MSTTHLYRTDAQGELYGVVLFEAALARHGFQVAQPRHDPGTDLIVYVDDPEQPLRALPVTFKVAIDAAFSKDWPYMSRAANTVVVYIWTHGDEARFFLVGREDVESVESIASDEDNFYAKVGAADDLYRIPQLNTKLWGKFEHRWTWLRDRLYGGLTT